MKIMTNAPSPRADRELVIDVICEKLPLATDHSSEAIYECADAILALGVLHPSREEEQGVPPAKAPRVAVELRKLLDTVSLLYAAEAALQRLEVWMARGNPPGGMHLPSYDGKTPSIQSDLRTVLTALRSVTRPDNQGD